MAESSRCLSSPAFIRNARPILEVLRRLLGSRRGNVLEIGSGPGQHIAAFAEAMPGLVWWPSDPDPRNLASIEAWREGCGCANLMPPVPFDATNWDWPPDQPAFPPNGDLAAMLCINVVHIAPWAVAEGVLRAAGRLLAPGSPLILYGPYSRRGVHTAASNAAFDATLRAQDPDWGVRDVADIATLANANALQLVETIEMPSNNLCLILQRLDGRP